MNSVGWRDMNLLQQKLNTNIKSIGFGYWVQNSVILMIGFLANRLSVNLETKLNSYSFVTKKKI